MALRFTTSYLEDSLELFRYYKTMGEKAIQQVTDEQLLISLDAESNSIAILVKHLAGNMRSRWTDFLTTDGEKPDRNRDGEFIAPPADRQSLLQMWETGWGYVFHGLESLTESDLPRTIRIRGEEHSVMQAINRQIAHYVFHVGQIVMLAKHLSHEKWKPLTIPRNQSAQYNQMVTDQKASQR